jgi:hypothetical protein
MPFLAQHGSCSLTAHFSGDRALLLYHLIFWQPCYPGAITIIFIHHAFIRRLGTYGVLLSWGVSHIANDLRSLITRIRGMAETTKKQFRPIMPWPVCSSKKV